jgi:hypothetical protein
VIRTGVILPTFRDTPADALAAGRRALAAGVDGVFCYDHLWPIGQPDRPALAPFPILATLATTVDSPPAGAEGPYFGTLVARIGLVPNSVLRDQFTALSHLAPGRVIAGLGTGDRLSAAENLAYGIPFPPSAERRADMVDLASSLRQAGLIVWVAGGAAARVVEVREAGAALNIWNSDPTLVASRTQGPEAVEVTWGGPPPKEEATLRQTVRDLAHAGATWVIFSSPIDPVTLVAAAAAVAAEPEPEVGDGGGSSGEHGTGS